MQKLAKELGVVIPISFFEKDGPRYYNSVAIADADGAILGVYRKSHIPDGPGYQEKYYFRPGDTGFKAWTTQAGTIGVGICWDQWYPEAARAMVLAGAEVLFYPTAIGSEPYDASLDTHLQWQRAMQGHAVSNAVPIVAANRIGLEDNDGVSQRFYGHSFIADHRGELVESLGARTKACCPHLRSRRDRELPRRLGLLPRPPPRPLRQEHRLSDGVAGRIPWTIPRRRRSLPATSRRASCRASACSASRCATRAWRSCAASMILPPPPPRAAPPASRCSTRGPTGSPRARYKKAGPEVVLDAASPLLHFDANGLPIHGVPWSHLAWDVIESGPRPPHRRPRLVAARTCSPSSPIRTA